MPENKNASSNKRHTNKRNNRRNPQKKQSETNSVKTSNEFRSFETSSMLSRFYFGSNIFNFYTPEMLKDLVKDPIGNNSSVRKLSLMLYGTNGSFTNTVDYMVAMPTLSRVIVPHGDSEKKKKRNKALMEETLRKIKDKESIRDTLFTGMIDGV